MPDSRRFWFSRKTPGDVKPEASTEPPADNRRRYRQIPPLPQLRLLLLPGRRRTPEAMTEVAAGAMTERRRPLPATRATTRWD
ncbi:hypothetical protein ABKU01_03515 [Enterobacter cloacae]|uniref:hypothetical protein n=1 Tax=Enterobacter cloacae TaxID=550 RepID=UPI0032AF738D